MAQQDRTKLHAALAAMRENERAANDDIWRLHRGCARFEVEAEGWLHPSARAGGNGHSIPVVLKDISRCGAAVVAAEPVDLCDPLPLTLCDDSLTIATLPTFVRHCQRIPGAEDMWLIGLDFGIDAGVLTALGVSPLDVLRGDQVEADQLSCEDSFRAPDDLGDEVDIHAA